MYSAAKRHLAKKPSPARPAAKSTAKPQPKPQARPLARALAAKVPVPKAAAAKMTTAKLVAATKPIMTTKAIMAAKALAAAKPIAKPVAPAVKTPGGRAPGVFETKVLTALKRHGGAAVSFSNSPDHIKAAFKRCFTEGWVTGSVDSGSLTPVGDKVLEKIKPEIRAFPAPTLRNRLNDALFRNQNKGATPPAAANEDAGAAAKPADDAEPGVGKAA